MQSLHSIHYEGDQYPLVESKPGLGFHPEQFGIVTEQLHTACLRGFVCTFAIRDGGLFLDSLEVLAKDGRYPEINGVPPACRGGPLRPALYFGLGRVPYTGTLRFGNDRDRTFHVDLFGPSIWMFRRVHEARIADGHVRSVSNISAKMARVRAKQPFSATTAGAIERMRKFAAELDKPIANSNALPLEERDE